MPVVVVGVGGVRVMLVVVVVTVPVVRIPALVRAAVGRFLLRVTRFRWFAAHFSCPAWGAMPWCGAVPRECSAWWMASATSCRACSFSSR